MWGLWRDIGIFDYLKAFAYIDSSLTYFARAQNILTNLIKELRPWFSYISNIKFAVECDQYGRKILNNKGSRKKTAFF